MSVIIPAYNAQDYLAACLDSILTQTSPVNEILLVNDGSQDKTDEIARAYAQGHPCIRYFIQENKGQGYSRNRALREATGDYILFVDSDDMLMPFTLERCRERILRDDPDFVHFEFRYFDDGSKVRYNYVNKQLAWRDILMGEQCTLLLTNPFYYTWTGLYRRDFLLRHNIGFGQGYIYEDHVFYAHCCLCAKRVSLLHAPLYCYREHGGATTKKDFHSTRHAQGLLRATADSLTLCERLEAPEPARARILNHKFNRFVYCYRTKTPRSYRSEFLRDYLELIAPVLLKHEKALHPLYRRLYRRGHLFHKRVQTIRCFFVFWRLRSRLLGWLKRLRTVLRTARHWRVTLRRLRYVRQANRPAAGQEILFLGFDFAYKGNSMYLYRDLRAKRPELPVYFVTREGGKGFVKKDSRRYFSLLGSAKVVIAESWLPAYIRKRSGQVFVQTWHATTVKRLLFDTAEPYTTQKNHRQKIKKFSEIQKWDYFITENTAIHHHYQSCFQLEPRQLVTAGYPRVQYLLEHFRNVAYRSRLREQLGIAPGVKTVLYAPTWRDYNYGKQKDFSYLPDFSLLCKELGEGYIILFKEHDFIRGGQEWPGQIRNVNDSEVQDLLLISDFVISDYSSIVFDAMAIDIPVLLYANDRAVYEKARGVYEDVFADLSHWSCANEQALCEAIRTYFPDKHYRYVQKKYCLREGNYYLTEFVAGLLQG